ncbi:hypothetical protein ACSZND_18070 [Aeromonas hydrophila]|uniref:hypothetical protein n=1 Tax=Aeromonas TaxID=642 RepID=UPI001117B38A|nr:MULTISPECIES: hypothetical protein [Aeromonas]MBW3797849.1 hypothetical protein [Aeromonas hydrophila]MBW3802782.1 hypothetical protein [Aeromonas hydrophila]MBW3820419.1 hypothetical protein [Aeromonas hydrophila]MCX4106344.1 hypothetical protein [Aeromonas hydrophila]TNJ16697.1 hypothetical protein CF112_21330 [Aeromonas hydrophila]
MPKYEVAYYYNEHEEWEPVSYRELFSDERRAELREKGLRDRADGNYQLGIRNHPKTPHFFEKKPVRHDVDPDAVESDAHNERRNMICNFLNKYEKHDFGYFETPWADEKGYENLLRVKNYEWAKEVKFGLVYGKFVLFDILGRHSSEVSLTDKNPLIAIEVVDTHFHSKQAFKVLLESTKNIPLLVGYMFLPEMPRLNSVKKPERSNWYSKNRIHCYLSDGSFWFRNERIEDLYNVSPSEPEVYYNLVREKLYEQGFMRRQNPNNQNQADA